MHGTEIRFSARYANDLYDLTTLLDPLPPKGA